mgnify:CR=1 FL=1
MDDGLSEIVKNTFIDLYNNRLIYRGNRLVNWDIKLQTAISDLEVINEEREGFLYHLEYGVKDSTDKIIVATTGQRHSLVIPLFVLTRLMRDITA